MKVCDGCFSHHKLIAILPVYIVSPQVCCAESELEEIQEWFNSRFKPWNATVITVDHPLPESGSSAMGRFLFSASPLMQELWGMAEYCQVLKM